jgi:hypothetical protein
MSDEWRAKVQELMAKFQPLVDELKSTPAFAGYVKQHKLSLLDDRFKVIDQMLDQGLLKD